MFFLSSIYQYVHTHFANRINHFPLIRLLFVSLDKTIFYFLLFLCGRWGYLFYKKKKISWRREFLINLLVIYLLLLLCLTVFRQHYFPWEFHLYWHRSLSEVNWVPFVETWKLTGGQSLVDFFYNSCGNVVWFLPLGYLLPKIKPQINRYWKIIMIGGIFSVLIESLQFILYTGVSDIDDVLFNICGAIIGYWLSSRQIKSKRYH